MKNEKIKYGNVTLGQINKMLISIIGESAFYYYCKEFNEKRLLDNYQSEEAFKKYVARLIKEEDSDFDGLNPRSEKSITMLVLKILDKLCVDYKLSPILANAINDYAVNLYHNIKENELPIYETYHCFRSQFYNIYVSYIVNIVENAIKQDNQGLISIALATSKEIYEAVFNEVAKTIGSKEKLYAQLSEKYNAPKEPVPAEHFKQIITNQIKDAKNPKWENMKQILDFLMEKEDLGNFAGLLCDAYIKSNIERFIKNETQIPIEQIEQMFKCGEFIYGNPPCRIEELENHIKNNQFGGMNKEKFDNAINKISSAMDAIFNKHIYLEDENQTKLFLEDVKNVAPEAAEFYCNWLRAFIELGKDNVLGAKNLYKKAFENRQFAGKYFEAFIKQAFALSVYDDFRNDRVRESIDPKKDSKTPLSNDAKKYWNYGYAIGIFEKPAEDTYLENFNRVKNFYSVFSSNMFVKNSKFKEDLPKNFMKEMHIVPSTYEEGEKPFGKDIETDYKKLTSLTEQTINDRVRMYGAENAPKIHPLSLSLYHASQFKDDRFLELAMKWLGIPDENSAMKNLNVNTVSDIGGTPLAAAIVQYKLCRFRETKLDKTEKHRMENYRKIVFKIIEKSTPRYFNVESKKTKRHPLQEAIESYDIDIVKAIIEKGLDINGLKISADACSPVYYTLGRIMFFINPQRETEKFNNQDVTSNMNWNNLNVPGLTTEEKMSNFSNMYEKMNAFGNEVMQASIFQNFGDKSTWQTQHEKLKEICLYLISKTANQDEFTLRNEIIGQSWTCLFFAVETDDVDICRALIKNGANPNLRLGITTDGFPVTFIRTCIDFQSWNVLEMYLTEFSEKAKETINDYDKSYRFTPLTYFLYRILEIKASTPKEYKGFAFVNHFVELFKSCGADFNIPSVYGDAKELLGQFKFL